MKFANASGRKQLTLRNDTDATAFIPHAVSVCAVRNLLEPKHGET